MLCCEVMAAVLSELWCRVHWLHCKSLQTTEWDDNEEMMVLALRWWWWLISCSRRDDGWGFAITETQKCRSAGHGLIFPQFQRKVRKGGQREDGDVVPKLQLQPRLTGFRLLKGWSRSGVEFLHQWPFGRRETARWRRLNVVGTDETRMEQRGKTQWSKHSVQGPPFFTNC